MLALALALTLGGGTPAGDAVFVTGEAEPVEVGPRQPTHEGLVRALDVRVRAATSEAALLATLDAALFEEDLLAGLFAAGLENIARAASPAERSLESLRRVVGEHLIDELSAGLRDAHELRARVARAHDALAAELGPSPDPRTAVRMGLEQLGDASRPLSERCAELAVLRSSLCAALLARAGESGAALPAWMAEVVVRLWRQGHEQVLAELEGRPAPALRDERLTDTGRVLLAYACRRPAVLGRALQEDRELVPLLLEIRRRLEDLFPRGAIAGCLLRPSFDADRPPGDVLVVEVHTPLGVDAALDAIAHFDEAWWAQACLETPREIIVDTRRV